MNQPADINGSSLPYPIGRLVKAVNRGDIESFFGFFPSDGMVDDSGRLFVGRYDVIRRWSDEEEFIDAKGHITITSCFEQTKNTVSVTVD
jgi:hypothetical protein